MPVEPGCFKNDPENDMGVTGDRRIPLVVEKDVLNAAMEVLLSRGK